MIVCKFGGTSVAGYDSSLNIKKIVNDDKNRKFIVVSALGKNCDYDFKITDKLLEAYYLYANGDKYKYNIEEVFSIYGQMAKHLNVKIDWEKQKCDLLKMLLNGNISKEYLVSRGEYYCALMYSKFLGATFLDAKDYIIFKNDKTLNLAKTKARLKKLNKNNKYIIGGFYGSNEKGQIVLFDRGGADITGAVIAKCLMAEIYENYTDVNGVYNMNPNIFFKAENLPVMDFNTALKMAENGSEIVHYDAIKQLKDTNVLLMVKSTTEYKKMGTLITHSKLLEKNFYVCNEKCLLITAFNFDKKLINKFQLCADVAYIFKSEKKYLIALKNNIRSLKYYTNMGYGVYQANVIKIFTNNASDTKTHKKLLKIKKKLKNYSVFCQFVQYYNNLIIIYKPDFANKIIAMLNKLII